MDRARRVAGQLDEKITYVGKRLDFGRRGAGPEALENRACLATIAAGNEQEFVPQLLRALICPACTKSSGVFASY